MIRVNRELELDEAELTFAAGPSSGPGGQHVNRASTRVTVSLAVPESRSLDAGQKAKILDRLAGRISKSGVLRVSSQRQRSQAANRKDALDRLVALLAAALAEDPERVETRVPPAQRRRRREAKRRRSRVKQLRGRPDDEPS